jgi:hypothetical protein
MEIIISVILLAVGLIFGVRMGIGMVSRDPNQTKKKK